MTKESDSSTAALHEAGRIVNEINNLKIQLNEILDFHEEFDDFYYRLRYYVMAIEEAEAQLLTNINLPHCEWATEINRSN